LGHEKQVKRVVRTWLKLPVTVRPFSIEDLKQILEIERAAFPKTGYPKEVILNYAKRLPDGFIVVETGEQIVGYMIFDQTGHVYSTAVRPSHRRKGFGRELFSHASGQSYGKLWLEVRSKKQVPSVLSAYRPEVSGNSRVLPRG
jgi:ribosomal protein S18 acetylase RimI-like enzyme